MPVGLPRRICLSAPAAKVNEKKSSSRLLSSPHKHSYPCYRSFAAPSYGPRAKRSDSRPPRPTACKEQQLPRRLQYTGPYMQSVHGCHTSHLPGPRPRVAPSHSPADAYCSPHQAVDAGSAGWLPGSSSVAIERSAAAAVEATVRAIVGAPGRAASSSSRVATRRSRVAPDEGGNQEVIRRSQRQQSEALGVPCKGGNPEAVRGTPTFRNGAREFLGPAAGGAIKRQSKGSTYRNGAREFLGPAAGGAIVRTGHEAVRAKGRHSLAWRLQEPGAPKAWSAVQAWAATAG